MIARPLSTLQAATCGVCVVPGVTEIVPTVWMLPSSGIVTRL